MLSAICICKQRIYIDQETGHKFNSNSTDDPHSCLSKAIPLYVQVFGCSVRRSEAGIAASIVDEALRLGVNPYKVRTVRKGDNLFLKL